jgi:O-antigen ligase
VFSFRRLSWKGTIYLITGIAVFFAVAWPTSSRLRERITDFVDEVRNYEPGGPPTPAGARLEFWRKSIAIVSEGPLLGHGTGSIEQQFRQSAAGQTGIGGLVTTNPHNQVFAIAIQLGLVGTLALLAMWIAHLLFFCDATPVAGIGLAVVLQNIVSSQFNSSLFDSTHGWLYVLGAGVLSGMALRDRSVNTSPK